ncbi:MAG: hypothetical protein IKL86_01000 [Clostridia bacterium]|nr:hypothetical protein [Clostridia bacterium]
MANTKNGEKKVSALKLALLRSFALAPEARNEEKKGEYPGGRFKRFKDMFKANSQDLMMANVLTILFALPIIAVVMFITILGAEKFGYMLESITETPYLMSGLGFGLSAGASIASAKVMMLMSYRIMVLAIAVLLPVLGFGFAGAMYISQKIVWGEKFLTKKDKRTGADVNRTITEFFNGVKIYWKEMVLTFALYAVFFAGGAELILEFVGALWGGYANVGHYFAVVIGAIILLLSTMIFVNLVPQVVSYHKTMKYAEKLKNAFLYTITFFVPGLFMTAFTFAPIALMFIGGFFTFIVIIICMSVGLCYMALLMANYGDYNSENVLQVLYAQSQVVETRKSKKDKKTQQGPVNYKKKKK